MADYIEKDDGAIVLCGASAYEEKYYFNDKQFSKLPEDIKKELRIICILFTQEIGGEFVMEFDEDGHLQLKTMARDSDYNYDEIGGALMIKQIRKERRDMFESLELFCKVVLMGVPLEDA